MSTIGQKLTQLEQDREDFVDNLTAKGIEDLTGDETFTQLVPRVLDISTGQIIQYEEVPTASEETVGQIIQYIGDTTQDYINGYFYKGLTDGGDPATYTWENVEVQDGGLSESQVKTLINNAGAIEIDDNAISMLRTYYQLGENDKLKIGHINEYYGGGIYSIKTTADIYLNNYSSIQHTLLRSGDANCIVVMFAKAKFFMKFYQNNGDNKIDIGSTGLYEAYNGVDTIYTLLDTPISFNTSIVPLAVAPNLHSIFTTKLITRDDPNQIINYALTFYTLPVCSVTPTINNQLVNKKYVDDLSAADLSNLAVAYDSTSTYNVGDYVIYDHVLYVCDQDIDVPEAFDNTKWSAVTINEVISNIEINELDANDLDEIINGSLSI